MGKKILARPKKDASLTAAMFAPPPVCDAFEDPVPEASSSVTAKKPASPVVARPMILKRAVRQSEGAESNSAESSAEAALRLAGERAAKEKAYQAKRREIMGE